MVICFKKIISDFWDIIIANISVLSYCVAVRWNTSRVQLAVAILSLFLLLIGLFSIFRKRITNYNTKKRNIEKLAQTQSTLKTIELANNPLKTGEEVGEILINNYIGGKKIMGTFFDKFKGFILAFLMLILALANQFASLGSVFFGDFFIVGGIDILQLILYAFPIVIAGLSNGFTGSQWETMLASINEKNAEELKNKEIENEIKTLEDELKQVEIEYKAVIDAKKRIDLYGGSLTADQSTIYYNQYITTRDGINAKIAELKLQLEKTVEVEETL